MSTMAISNTPRTRKPAALTYFLGMVFALFIGILIFCYAVTRRTTIIYLDQHGNPASASSDHSHH